MGPFSYNDQFVTETLRTWLQEQDLLFVDVHFVNFPGKGPDFFINSIDRYKNLVLYAENNEMNINSKYVLSIFKNAYPIRGIFSESLLSRAKNNYREGENWSILGDTSFPGDIDCIASGDTWEEIQNDLQDYKKVCEINSHPYVCIGKDPDFPDENWIELPDTDRITVINYKNKKG